MNITLLENGLCGHAEMLKRKLSERISVDFASDGGLVVELLIDKDKGAECYEIAEREQGYVIVGGDSVSITASVNFYTAHFTRTGA